MYFTCQVKRRKLENRIACRLSDAAVSLYPQQAAQLQRLQALEAQLSSQIAARRSDLMAAHASPNWQRRTLR